jgi:hypothetical protein
MKKKLVGILFCMLLVVPVLSVTVVADDEPELEIEIRWNKKSLTAFIRNVGDGDAYGVNWSFDIEGGFLGFVDYHIGGVIEILPAGSETSVENSLFLFGLGPIMITISIGASNAETMTETFRGIIVGRFIILRG